MEVYSPHLGHMTKMAAMPMYSKNPLKIFATKGPVALGPGMQHWEHGKVNFFSVDSYRQNLKILLV